MHCKFSFRQDCITLPEKVLAPHSSTLAWKIPWTEEPGRLQSMSTRLSDFTFTHWRRKRQPTPVLLPGKSHGRRSLVGCSPCWTRLSDFTFTFHFHALEKETATHSSVLAWRIPGTEKPCRLPVYGVTQNRTRLKRLSSSSSSRSVGPATTGNGN